MWRGANREVGDHALASIWKISWLRQLRRRSRRPLQVAAAPVLTNYIKFVISTSTVVSDPPNWLARVQALHPSIIALWHGQFLLLPGIYPPVIPGRAMISRHDDAEALARVLRYFGLGLILALDHRCRCGGLRSPLWHEADVQPIASRCPVWSEKRTCPIGVWNVRR